MDRLQGRDPGKFNMELNTILNTEEETSNNNSSFVNVNEEGQNESFTIDSKDKNTTSQQLMHSCPIWVKMNEIPHPALIPGFISRRECLQDGSLDPTTSSVPIQASLLSASTLSSSLLQVVSNIPTGLMLESVHKKNLKHVVEVEEESGISTSCVLGSFSPAHYVRTSDPTLTSTISSSNPNTNSNASVAQTAAELSALNILYGGVKGKAYLDSLEEFVAGISLPENDSTIRPIIQSKLEGVRSACGYKILNMNCENLKVPLNQSEVDQITSSAIDAESFGSLTRENNLILTLLQRSSQVDEANRTALLTKLEANLRALMALCPEEVKNGGDLFKGVDVNLNKFIK